MCILLVFGCKKTMTMEETRDKPAKDLTGVEVVISMNSDVYEKHTKPIVQLRHSRHSEGIDNVECINCHHDYMEPADVQKCGSPKCHDRSIQPKDDRYNNKKKNKIRVYHYYAIHELCVGCHRKVRERLDIGSWTTEASRAKRDRLPVTCKQCHIEGK